MLTIMKIMVDRKEVQKKNEAIVTMQKSHNEPPHLWRPSDGPGESSAAPVKPLPD